MIRSGTAWYGTESEGWNLHTGLGERSFRTQDVSFDAPFSTPPKVLLALGGIDSDRTTNLRVVLEAYDIEPGEFSIRIRTWDDTVIHNVLIAWIAHD